MHNYTVLDTSDGGTVALRDDLRRYHVAHLHTNAPSSGEHLQGNAPGVGCSLLLSNETGEVYGLTFEEVDCGQERTLALVDRND